MALRATRREPSEVEKDTAASVEAAKGHLVRIQKEVEDIGSKKPLIEKVVVQAKVEHDRKIAELDASLASHKVNIEAKIIAANEEFSSIKVVHNKLFEEYKNLLLEVRDLKEEKQVITNEISALESRKVAAQDAVRNVEEKKSIAQNDYSVVQSLYAELKMKVKSLDYTIETLEKQIIVLKEKNTELEKTVIDSQVIKDGLAKDIGSESQKLASLRDDLRNVIADLAQAKIDAEQVRSNSSKVVEDANSRHKTLTLLEKRVEDKIEKFNKMSTTGSVDALATEKGL